MKAEDKFNSDLHGRSSRQLTYDKLQMNDKSLPADLHKTTINEKIPGDELVDVKVENFQEGRMRLKFSSHGRDHKFVIAESQQQLSKIPIKFLGMLEKNKQKVEEQLQVSVITG